MSNFQAPRGKGGVAIAWHREWSHLVKCLEDGNEQIAVIELQCQEEKLCIVYVYMPTLNLPQSKATYQEHLDLLYSILAKYKESHRIVICGDFNATLLHERSNPHDKMLKKFVQENDLVNTVLVPDHTFFSHTGMASSQLDYIFTIDVTTEKHIQTKVNDFISCNTSSHVHLLMTLRASVAAVEKTSKSTHQKSVRFRWDRVIVEKFQSEIMKELMKFPNLECIPVDRRHGIITEVLKQLPKTVYLQL